MNQKKERQTYENTYKKTRNPTEEIKKTRLGYIAIMSKEELFEAAENGNSAKVRELAPKLTQADIDWRNPDKVSNARSVHTNTHI